MEVSMEDVKKLRAETGAGVMDCKKALESLVSYGKAREYLVREGALKASKKADRAANEGLVAAYIHSTGKVGSLVMLNCETDFVAKTDVFRKLCQELALQVAAIPCETVEELLNQEYIRDTSRKVSDLVTEAIAKVGENIKIAKFCRFKIGQ